MMYDFECRILIRKPIREVFLFLSDFENIPKWDYSVLIVQKVSGEGPGIGTTYQQIRKTDEQLLRVTEYLPNQSIVVRTLPGSSPPFERRFIFRQKGERTFVRDYWKLDIDRRTLVEKLIAGKLKSTAADNLRKLKELLEQEHVTLPDGRQFTI